MGNSPDRARSSWWVLIGSGAAFGVATSWLLLTAPGRVPSRFAGSGEITEWTELGQYVAASSASAVGVALVCGGAQRYIPRIPARALKVAGPRADFWARSENRHEFDAKLTVDLEWVGVLIMLTIVWVTCLSSVTVAGIHVPFWIRPTVTLLLMATPLVYAGYITCSRRYRPSPEVLRTPQSPSPPAH